MPDLPVMLRVSHRRCVIVGGGPVALRRAQSLVNAGAHVTVIAPQCTAAFQKLAVTVLSRVYQPGDLDEAFLVVIATDDPAVNQAVTAQAQARHVLVNRADAADEGDLTIPAHSHHGPVTLSVHTGGISATAAAAIHQQLCQALDPDWLRLLETIAPYRQQIKAAFPDPRQRQQKLSDLAGPQALAVFKSGGSAALECYCRSLLAPAHPQQSS